MNLPVLPKTFADAKSWWSQVKILNNPNLELLLPYAIGGLALIWVVLIFSKKSTKGKPPLPPGPRAFPLVGNLLSLDPELHTYFAHLSKIYGPIFTLWLGKKEGIIITSQDVAREVLKDQDTTFANRDVAAAGREAFYGGRDIVCTPYGPEWRMLRKVCAHELLSNSTLDSFYALRRKELRQTIKFFHSQAGKPVNIGEQMFFTSVNVITSMMWGGTVEVKEKAKLEVEFRQVVTELNVLLGSPNLSDFYPILARFDLQGIGKRTRNLAKRFDAILERIIEQRSKIEDKIGDGESKDFVQYMLKLVDDKDAKIPLTLTHLKGILMDMVIGGTESSANIAEFALAEMMNRPRILKKLEQELETVVGKHRVVEESDIPKMPYLCAVMKEVLRLHPPVPLLVPHTPSKTSTVAGYTIPKGSRVFVNIWAIHRDPLVWENPLEFRPERFLQETKWDYTGNDFNYIPFGSGRRICVGTLIAERMFMFSVASLIHSFKWDLPKCEKLDLDEKFGIVLKKRNPLIVIPIPKLFDASLYE